MKAKISLLFILLFSFNAHADFPEDFSDVIWIDPDISSWAETATLDVGVSGGTLFLISDKASVWPIGPNGNLGNNTCCNRNVWAFINYEDQWYAITFEWMGFGQGAKAVSSFEGGHMKRPPFLRTGFRWTPRNGEIYGFMVSGFARFNLNFVNVAERSEIAFYQWGVGPYEFPEPKSASFSPVLDLLLDEEPHALPE